MSEVCLVTKAWRFSSGWIAQALAEAIAVRGASIAFVAPCAEPASREPKHRNLKRLMIPRELVGSRSRLARIFASLRRMGASWWAVCRMRISSRNFLFMIPEPLIVTLPLFVLLRASRARVFFLVHDSQPHAWSLPRMFQGLERRAHQWSYQFASTLVVLTPTVRDALVADFGINAEKIVVIPHGPLPIGEVAPIQGSRLLLVFGSLRRNKSVLEVIRAIILVRQRGINVRLILAGEPLAQEVGYWDECLDATRADPAAFDVRVGFVPDASLPALIAEVDALVLAYQDFSSQSGVAILGALAGRPIIGTRAGGLGELFDHGMAGENIEGADDASIAAAIVSFYSVDISVRRLQAERGAAKIGELLQWDDIADRYIKLLRTGAGVSPA